MRSSAEISILISLARLRRWLRHYVLICGPHARARTQARMHKQERNELRGLQQGELVLGLGMRPAFAVQLPATVTISCDQSSY